MDHQIIEAENIVERYVTGRLSAEQSARFEEHYLDCQACIDRVEEAERLDRGLRRLAAAEASKAVIRAGLLGGLLARSRSRQAALGLMLAVVLLVPTALHFRRTGLLQEELAAARHQRDELALQLEDERRPQVNPLLIPLSAFRGAGPGPEPAHRIVLPSAPQWIVLLLDPAGSEYPAYRTTLLGADGSVVWETSEPELSPQGTVDVSLHSTFLSQSEYQFHLEGLPAGGEPVSVARYLLRVTHLP